jgi:hypothetical protein
MLRKASPPATADRKHDEAFVPIEKVYCSVPVG